jgi:hypothetical protein
MDKHEMDCLHWVGASIEVSEEMAAQENFPLIYNYVVDNALQHIHNQLRYKAHDIYKILPLNAEGNMTSNPKDVRKVSAELVYLPATTRPAGDAIARQKLILDVIVLLKQLHKEPFQRFWDEINAILLRADVIVDKYREK